MFHTQNPNQAGTQKIAEKLNRKATKCEQQQQQQEQKQTLINI